MQQGAGGGGSGFFGALTMAREFWAEDPDWTNPGDGISMTTWRDNGTIGADVTSGSKSGGALPTYQSSLINSKPGVDFNATANAIGGYMTTATGTVATPMSIVVVGRVDVINSSINAPYMVDANHASVYAAMGALNSGSQWTTYHNAGLNANGGSWDSDPHLFVLVIKTNDFRFYVDGSLTAQDASGTADTVVTGLNMGIDRAGGGSCLNGALSYVAHYAGDITTDGGYADFVSAINTHYSL